MKSNRSWVLTGALLLALTAATVPVLAQPETEVGVDEPEEELTSRIKQISISLRGGRYGGTTYLDLPVVDERAQLAEGSNTVTLYNGEILDLGDARPVNGFDAPIKEIEPGESFGFNIGFFLSDAFHIDLNAGYVRSRAVLSMARFEDEVLMERVTGADLDPWYEGFYDRTDLTGGSVDDNFRSYMGGISVSYDAHTLRTLGLTPIFGMGFGGIINRFTVLEDKTALYFQLYGGLDLPISDRIHVNTLFKATTYSFQTEEVVYSEQVTTLTGQLGLTFLFDVKPIY